MCINGDDSISEMFTQDSNSNRSSFPAVAVISSDKQDMTEATMHPDNMIAGDDKSGKRTVCHDYHDHANVLSSECVSEEDEADASGVSAVAATSQSKKRRGPRGGVAVPFPEKLHQMLSSIDGEGMSHIVSWQPHGRCFVVHKPKEFVAEVMPFYFRQTKLTSFQRQLNLYGFCRLTSGRDRGGYYHELFLRGRPFLCKRMMRTRIKGTGIKAASSPSTEVRFALRLD